MQYIEWSNNDGWLMDGSNDRSHVWRSCSLILGHKARLLDGSLLFTVLLGQSCHQAMLPGQLDLPWTICFSFSLVMPITEKFQVLNFTFRESVYHLINIQWHICRMMLAITKSVSRSFIFKEIIIVSKLLLLEVHVPKEQTVNTNWAITVCQVMC